jgi:hypothetical protein
VPDCEAVGAFSPKNSRDHSAFSTSCTRTVYAGPKAQLGWVKSGFAREAYHVGMAGAVAREPTSPASRHMMMLAASPLHPMACLAMLMY